MKKETNRSLKLGKYAYLNARVRAMKAKLVRPDEYQKLLKVSHSEISRFLEDGDYKKEIDELAVKYSGADLLELAVNANASATFRKIINLSKGDAKLLISEYLKRWDIANLKTVLRGVRAKTSEEEVKMIIIPGGQLSEEQLLGLLKKDAMAEVIQDPAVVKVLPYLKSYKEPHEGATLAFIENRLDMCYYKGLLEIASALPKNAVVFKTFLRNEIDTININTLLVMKKENVESKDIISMLIMPGANISRNVLEGVAASKSLEDMLDALEKTQYSKEITAGKDEALEGSLSVIRRELDKSLMRKAFLLLHQHPLSIAPVLGYILAKEIEIKNLRLMSRAKSLLLSEDFIEENLIVA